MFIEGVAVRICYTGGFNRKVAPAVAVSVIRPQIVHVGSLLPPLTGKSPTAHVGISLDGIILIINDLSKPIDATSSIAET